MVSLHCMPQPPSMLPGPYSANLWSAFNACHNHHPCSLASTLPTYSLPSLLATTTIHALWSLLCQLIVSLHCLPQPPSMLPGVYSANLWPAFIACHNCLSCALAPTLKTYSQPSLPATTMKSSLASTLPNYGKPSLLPTTTTRAPWLLLCQLKVCFHCLPQPSSVLPGLYSATL
ncbi:hypothetical protein PoB_003912400 [Plakobranchus ocellatus]|uniref:Uncharacterized protein n=1 Tax=Plakobranchus ocellatus TaxID=259542 RepID=A0AAV4AXW9_9GAST|nr:hypothetical protein PoB_003912400 [Plakobranchus ocellatus]